MVFTVQYLREKIIVLRFLKLHPTTFKSLGIDIWMCSILEKYCTNSANNVVRILTCLTLFESDFEENTFPLRYQKLLVFTKS